MVRHKNSFWSGSNIGIFEINAARKIIYYIPKQSAKFEFGPNDKFVETIACAGV
jgi:hypothetical protein